KARAISGFPEWLPEQRMVEQRLLDGIRTQFELFGFAPIETRAVEPIEQLVAKGETDKEIYTLRRLQGGEDERAELGLHFDLTVPLARYVAQNLNDLRFPFKRYQIQKAWRGERPQEGRYREFTQADIDVVGRGSLSLHFDAEMPVLVHQVMTALPEIPPVTIRFNNRKLVEGVMRGLGVEDVAPVMRALDKLDKRGAERVGEDLRELGVPAEKLLAMAQLRGDVVEGVRALGVEHELVDEGLEELAFVMRAVEGLPVVADLSIVRGLDYYTGTVYETTMDGHESVGAICSGGRYDNLVQGGKDKLPGVGVSIGVTRILGRLFGADALPVGPKTPTQVLVALTSEEERGRAREVASELRARGIPTEVFHEPVKFGRQIAYADGKGIPYVWFTDSGEVKDLRSGEQRATSVERFEP
ncbi:MAG TPA: histidine--tRNA ligase, partial [Solirubrobacteraceae bacterium]|nr:histidine--tRNA ligase [Solirubrobacteraceae bacterium]